MPDAWRPLPARGLGPTEDRKAMSVCHPRPWHHGSLFGDGPRVPLDREARAVWRARLGFARRAGRITSLHAEIGLALLRRLSQEGRCDPSHQTIAEDAGVSDRTVRRALRALATCGLLTWVRRLVRNAASAWQARQTSNAYALTLENAAPAPSVAHGGQLGRGSPRRESSTGAVAQILAGIDIEVARAALATRRRVVEQELLRKG